MTPSTQLQWTISGTERGVIVTCECAWRTKPYRITGVAVNRMAEHAAQVHPNRHFSKWGLPVESAAQDHIAIVTHPVRPREQEPYLLGTVLATRPVNEWPVRVGGLMRCCTTTLRVEAGWAREGQVVNCLYCPDSMRLRDGAWGWNRD